MTPAWTDEDLACLARDYRNHPDVYDLIEGVRRVLALHVRWVNPDDHEPYCAECGQEPPCDTVRLLNDPPNGATP